MRKVDDSTDEIPIGHLKCGRKQTRCADCKIKRKKCEHTSDNATDSDTMVVDTPDTGGDLEWQERGKIDGFGDGIRLSHFLTLRSRLI